MKKKVLLVLALVVAGLWIRSVVVARARNRYVEAQERATERCKAFRQTTGHEVADVCQIDPFSPDPLPMLKAGERALDEARAALASGDRSAADAAITRALGEARRAERSGTSFGEVVAAKLVRQALDVLDRHHAAFPAGRRLELVAGLKLERAEHPFEADRAHHDWSLAQWAQLAPERPLSPGVLADEMTEDGARFERMEAALLRGNVAACASAADEIGRQTSTGYPRSLCEKMLEVRRTAVRLHATRTEATRQLGRDG